MNAGACETQDKGAQGLWVSSVRSCADSCRCGRVAVESLNVLDELFAIDLVCKHHDTREEIRLRYFMGSASPQRAIGMLFAHAGVPGYVL